MHTTQVNVTTGETVQIPYTTEEQTEYDAKRAAWNAGANTRKAAEVRAKRDAKLSETDWRVIKALENDTLQEFEWAEYRQELRDITKQPGFPNSVTWPVEP